MKFSLRRDDQLKPKEPQTFFVTSYGRTATYWLAGMMNVHPEIYCTHGPTLTRFAEFADDPPPEHTSKVFREQDAYYARSLQETVEAMREIDGGARVYGNVHAFSAVRLDKKIRADRYGYPCTRVNLLRHPFTRLESYARHCVKQCADDPYMKAELQQFVANHRSCQEMWKMVVQKFNVDRSRLENDMFLLALVMLGNDLSDTQVPCRQISYERLVKDAEYFVWFFHLVTGHSVAINDEVLESYRSTQRRNSATTKDAVSVEVYRQWESWKQYLVRFLLETSKDMVALYTELDYDLSLAIQ
jgi:hypothetical protein